MLLTLIYCLRATLRHCFARAIHIEVALLRHYAYATAATPDIIFMPHTHYDCPSLPYHITTDHYLSTITILQSRIIIITTHITEIACPYHNGTSLPPPRLHHTAQSPLHHPIPGPHLHLLPHPPPYLTWLPSSNVTDTHQASSHFPYHTLLADISPPYADICRHASLIATPDTSATILATCRH